MPFKYDDALPIVAWREDIITAIGEHPVVIVAGETGSGKSTQLPRFCLEAGRAGSGMIGITQPRRIAARSVAQRVAEEMGESLGRQVGYQVRFREQLSHATKIKFMTDGILLAEIHSDPHLRKYDTIIVDEAHERSLNIDFLLGYLHRLTGRRPDLKIIITSATIDTDKFSRHFNNAPVIEVSGRSYPVEMQYRPLIEGEQEKDLNQGIHEAVKLLYRQAGHGDILVFLSGEREIREARDYLEKKKLNRTDVLPLFARLSSVEQQRIFHPGTNRRIILATNVAETSLTVPRVKFVIDSGLARISRYSHRSKVLRLPVEAISQASAKQRAGRCGRLGPGTCIRLFAEDDFDQRPEFTEPEILRTSLASVMLRMAAMDLGDIEEFPFVDPPPKRLINDAWNTLLELNAMGGDRQITPLGKKLARWPVDVRVGRMLLEAGRLQCLSEVLILAAVLSIQDPRERPLDAPQAADAAHQVFRDPKSDFMTLLKLWNYLVRERKVLSNNQFRKLCKKQYLAWHRVREWFDLHRQFVEFALEAKMRRNRKSADYAAIHKALLSGLLSHAGRRDEKGHYLGARGKQFYVFPGSGLFTGRPQWIMAAEQVETSRVYARINAGIKPQWLEQQGRHLVKRHHFDPHWSRRRGRVMAWEQVSLYGLVIVEKRPVDYGQIDAAGARRIFIRDGLVNGDINSKLDFIEHNRGEMEAVQDLEHRRRRHDVLVDPATLADFFDARLPEDICNVRQLEQWWQKLEDGQRQNLRYSQKLLIRDRARLPREKLFPDQLFAGDHDFPLEYRFEPGHDEDGVTLTVPLKLLNTVDAGRLQWLVPGLLRDKIVALIKALPKTARRALTPPAQFADAFIELVGDTHDGRLHRLLSEEFKRMTGIEIASNSWDENAVPGHLRVNIRVQDESGKTIASNRDLDCLREKLGGDARAAFMAAQTANLEAQGIEQWDFGELPLRSTTKGDIIAYPALVDKNDSVAICLFDHEEAARASHQDGVRRLLVLQLADKLRYLRKNHGIREQALMAWSPLGGTNELAASLLQSTLQLLAPNAWEVRDDETFAALLTSVRSELIDCYTRRAGWLSDSLDTYQEISVQLEKIPEDAFLDATDDLRSQLHDLVYEDFLDDLDPQRLEHYPRYLNAMLVRLERLLQNPRQDELRAAEVYPWWRQYQNWLEQGHEYTKEIDTFRWLLHEYRVSQFAQLLGTREKVSPVRLDNAWQEVIK